MFQIKSCYKNRIKIGAQQSYKNLTMFPLLTGYSIPRNYLTVMESMSKYNIDQTGSIHNIIRKHGNGRETTSWDYTEQFASVEGQIGAIFLINGKLAGMVCLQDPEAFKKSFIKMVECYAKKADGEYEPTMGLIS